MIKEILYRAAERAQVHVTLLANKLLGVPRSPWIKALQVARGGHAINPRGELYTADNIRERLATRDFMEMPRETGVQTGGGGAAGWCGSEEVWGSAGSVPGQSKTWVLA